MKAISGGKRGAAEVGFGRYKGKELIGREHKLSREFRPYVGTSRPLGSSVNNYNFQYTNIVNTS